MAFGKIEKQFLIYIKFSQSEKYIKPSTTNYKQKKRLGFSKPLFYYAENYNEFLLSKSFMNATNFFTPSIGIAL